MFYIKDFATTNEPDRLVILNLSSNTLVFFTNCIRNTIVNLYEKAQYTDTMKEEIDKMPKLPNISDNNQICLLAGWASELLMHLRNVYIDFDREVSILIDDWTINWKKINK